MLNPKKGGHRAAYTICLSIMLGAVACSKQATVEAKAPLALTPPPPASTGTAAATPAPAPAAAPASTAKFEASDADSRVLYPRVSVFTEGSIVLLKADATTEVRVPVELACGGVRFYTDIPTSKFAAPDKGSEFKVESSGPGGVVVWTPRRPVKIGQTVELKLPVGNAVFAVKVTATAS